MPPLRNHDVNLVPPEAILLEIGHTVNHDDDTLPSVGTEAATVHAFEGARGTASTR